MAKKKLLKEGEILRGRKFRFYPDFDQRAKIDGTLEACRVVQNNYIILNQEREKAEEEKEKEAKERGEDYKKKWFVSAFDYIPELTRYKKEEPQWQWLRQYSSVALSHAIMDTEQGYKRFFDALKKHQEMFDKPDVKGKKTYRNASYYFAKKDGLKFDVEDKHNKVKIPVLDIIEIREPEYLPDFDSVVSGRIARKGTKYFLTLQYKTEKTPLDKPDGEVYINMFRTENKLGCIYSDKYDPIEIQDPKSFPQWERLNYRLQKMEEARGRKTDINKERRDQDYENGNGFKVQDELTHRLHHSMSYESNRLRKLKGKISDLYTRQGDIESEYYNKVISDIVAMNPEKVTVTRPERPKREKQEHQPLEEGKKKPVVDRFYKFMLKLQTKCEEHDIELVINEIPLADQR